ncbi:hypothetical protein BSZ35_04495 [Salinibacter sp. 10B]|uniref:hypothetical protein n=1 Tax=Salinibacter sp. 10B TaxID=1923971 RepID=UPI000CF571EF|nr:hypothetical protein [Salinibacter sp. 10B]PQJ33968.1 hypothetical protein BSZ35_04495 [Salinibacter sp. 10B]
MISFPLDIAEPEVDSEALESLYNLSVAAPTGGMYPVGANGLWHGGVHLSLGETPPVYACTSGRIVAARLDPDPERATCEYGHTNFLLTKHTWPPGAAPGSEEATPYFVVYAHLLPTALEGPAQTPANVPWLSTEPHLRVTDGSGLRLREEPDGSGLGEGASARVVPGQRLVPLSVPVSAGGTQWQEVRPLGSLDYSFVPTGYADLDKTEETEPPVTEAAVDTLRQGNVAALDVPVEPGTMLWSGGEFGLEFDWADAFEDMMDEAIANARELMGSDVPHPEPIERAPTVHWEVFSGEKIFGLGEEEVSSGNASSNGTSSNGASSNGDGSSDGESGNGEAASDGQPALPPWTAVEDSASDLVCDPKESEASALIDQKREEAPDLPDPDAYLSKSLDEKKTVHFLETGKTLRTYAVKHVSEWGIKDVESVLEKSPRHSKEEHLDPFEALQWWGEAEDAGVELPDSRKVWHYHPVTVLKALAATHPWFYLENDGEPQPVRTNEEVWAHAGGDGQNVYVEGIDETWKLGYTQTYPPTGTRGLAHNPDESPNLYEMLMAEEADGIPRDAFSEFERRVWASLSYIEGTLAAINTFDSAYLSVGPLQKTAGAKDPFDETNTYKGELFGAIDCLLNPSEYDGEAVLSDSERETFEDALRRHIGDKLSFADGEFQSGVPKAHPKIGDTVLSAPGQKERFRNELKWPYRFAKAYKDPEFREPMLRLGFKRLDTVMSQEISFTVTVDGTDHEITVELDDLFSRDLSQALLLGWHINYPAPVWEPENSEWFRTAPDPEDDIQKSSVVQKLSEWEITSAEDLRLTRDQELRLVVLLLRARMDSPMTDPAGRAGKILRYAPNDLVEEIVETMGFTRGETESQMDFIERGFKAELYEEEDNGDVKTSAWAGWNEGERPEDPNQDAILTDLWEESRSA